MKRAVLGVKVGDNAMNIQKGIKNSKRKAEGEPSQDVKRCALGDISNAKSIIPIPLKGKAAVPMKAERVRVTRQSTKKNLPPPLPEQPEVPALPQGPSKSVNRSQSVRIPEENISKTKGKGRKSESSATENVAPEDDSDHSFLYKTANEIEDSTVETLEAKTVEELNEKNKQLTKEASSKLPDDVIDFDLESGDDPFQMGIYAQEIFNYYKSRELKFPVLKYLGSQAELNKGMRTILVDWMVEVQESFELNHETLYLAVKIIDLFLGKMQIPREKLQLVGTTAFWIAAKFDERISPSIDDFCYICDDAYPTNQIIKMEVSILKALKYDIGFPLSYRFLRRFARVAKLEMETLTLARFILESSLMEYDFIDIRDSMMACAVLWLALYIQGNKQPWSPTLAYYSGYKSTDLYDLTNRLLTMLRNPPNNVKTIRSKYSHTVFYGVAKIPLPDQISI